ncbi:MAG: RNA polymerase factor sigma-54 [Armatimonadota bacterium]
MLELRSEAVAAVEQVPSVNCQLIMRSELLELPYLELLTRMREEAEENPAVELEYDPPWEIPTFSTEHYSGRRGGGGTWAHPTTRAPAEHGLREELHRRIGWAAEGRRREIALYLIENIDDRGYLTTTVLDAVFELDAEPAEVEEALRALQSVAPPGVGARDLRECLLLQLEALPDVPDHARAVVEHCEQVLDGDGGATLRGALGLTRAQVQQALELIRTRLTPYPGEQFRPRWHHLLPGSPHATAPDVALRAAGEHIEVELATSGRVRVKVAEAYRRLDERMRTLSLRADDEATSTARAQVRAARQLIWSLRQRERSLYAITRAIVDHQREFILDGPLAHRPLTHKRIAEVTGLHESTVSRATSGKLVMLPSGHSVPFSVFFDDALPAKTVLRGLVAAEPSSSPWTDEELQALMAERGFDIARRTVNKYRRALGIPSSGQRRRMYRAA